MKTTLMKYALRGLLLPLLTGCHTGQELATPDGAAGGVTVRFEAAASTSTPLGTARVTADDMQLGTVVGFRFEQGRLREIAASEATFTGSSRTFHLRARSGSIYFVANPPAKVFEEMQPDVTTLEAFLAAEAPVTAMTADGLTMTGSAELSAAERTLTVALTRSVARLDLASTDAGVEVHSIVLRGAADRGYVNGRSDVTTPPTASTTEFRREYGDTPLVNGRETLLYLAEQSEAALTAEVVVRFGGGWHRMEAALPAEIRRNTTYTLQVRGQGSELRVEIEADGWLTGDSIESRPDLRGLIDLEASELPDGVRVNELRDTVRIAHAENRFRLVLLAEPDSELRIEGHIDGVTATPEELTRGVERVAAVSVEKRLFMPGHGEGYLCLDLLRGNLRSGRVVLIFEENPIRMRGQITFDSEGVCDFDRYIDGELATLSLPEGAEARLEFDADEALWMKLEPAQDEYRLLGGWKPNDPKADGRVQEARLIVDLNDGSPEERYTIRRRNWGLPVVEIGRNWWCKYNLRGNVKRFEEQVTIQEDPATEAELADFLAACDNEQLLALMGEQYQGGKPDGLPLRHNGEAFYHEGMQETAGNFGTLDPTAMAPDGYRIPDHADYGYFSANDNFNLGGIGERPFWNRTQDRVWVRIIEREAEFLGATYGTVTLYEFTDGTNHWVLYGLGHQWNTTPGNIARMNLLMATWGNSGKTWSMEGYAQSDRPNQNWLKYVSQNATKTRSIRCIKTPVEYIYD